MMPPETVTPFDDETPAVDTPPEKVEVAPFPKIVVEEVPPITMRSRAVRAVVEAPAVKVVSAPKVLVPVNVWPDRLRSATLELSAASAMVPADWPIQPRTDWKQPAVMLNPLFEVVVAPEEIKSAPPVRVRPFDDDTPAIDTPPVKVEVAPLPRSVVDDVPPMTMRSRAVRAVVEAPALNVFSAENV